MAKDQVFTAEEVFAIVATYMNDKNVKFVEKSYETAEYAHREQFRKSGEPYIIHPIQVAGILAQLQMDPATV
ncbi:MAG TPA: bifunctional (p)ppGpp synthetase/guanosine-3',5'-bis(diphosphate) 3'-pyrophosphohydrolase, partial [Paenisporosarcina sp.]|nr:bifunctional (p)ppGpp synthetase/guanosine-3',5'-bis(diphosphate) 3'-pyrophosphohydrolase [Paenisporosarcina sp.]